METVDLEEARRLIASNEVDVIDLRDEDGWVEGHIPGAHRAADDLDAKLEAIAEDRRLLIVCADGEESAQRARELDEGDRDAISLEGGMDAWLSGGLPSQPSGDYEPGPVPVKPGDQDEEEPAPAGDDDTGEEEEPARGA